MVPDTGKFHMRAAGRAIPPIPTIQILDARLALQLVRHGRQRQAALLVNEQGKFTPYRSMPPVPVAMVAKLLLVQLPDSTPAECQKFKRKPARNAEGRVPSLASATNPILARLDISAEKDNGNPPGHREATEKDFDR